jgi:type II secretory ATPase GspE/PulE/Tfp pilus assembly ATPase PilB-like protein
LQPLSLEKEKVSDHFKNLLNIDFDIYRQRLCDACGGIGYREEPAKKGFLMMNEEIRKASLSREAPHQHLGKKLAKKKWV